MDLCVSYEICGDFLFILQIYLFFYNFYKHIKSVSTPAGEPKRKANADKYAVIILNFVEIMFAYGRIDIEFYKGWWKYGQEHRCYQRCRWE